MAITQYPAEWDDIIPGGVAVRSAGVTDPNVTDWGLGYAAYEFENGTARQVMAAVQFFHACKQGGVTVSPHVHCVSNATITSADTITFTFECSHGSIGSQFPAVSTLTANYSPSTTLSPRTHLLIESQDLFITITPSSILNMNISRSTADSYSGSVWLLAVDVHAQIDSRGSQQEYLK